MRKKRVQVLNDHAITAGKTREIKQLCARLLGFCLERSRIGLPDENLAVTLRIADDETVRRFNREFLDRDRATDVIAWPFLEEMEQGWFNLGDIIVSADQADLYARAAERDPVLEVLFLFCHGLLHLLGYNDQTAEGKEEMIRLQKIFIGKILPAPGEGRGGDWS